MPYKDKNRDKERIREKRLDSAYKAKERVQRIEKMATPEEKLRRKKYKQSESGKLANQRYQRKHKERMNEYALKWKRNNPDKVKGTALKSKYNISLNDWKELWIKQKGACAICGTPFATPANAHTDHDHKTGKVRGLLCLRHNLGIGTFNDDINLFKNAIRYLFGDSIYIE